MIVQKDKEEHSIMNVIVFYDNLKEVLDYFRSATSTAGSQEADFVIVVNKNSCELDLAREFAFLNLKDRLYILYPSRNVGYINALFFAITSIKKSYLFYILCNTDISYQQHDFFSSLLFKCFPADVGCVAPSVSSPNGDIFSNPHYIARISKFKMMRNAAVFSMPEISRIFIFFSRKKAVKTKSIKRPSQYVYSPHGCYMIFCSEFAKLLANEFYPPILYSEESFVGELLRIHGFKCYYDSSLQVIHYENAVTKTISTRNRLRFLSSSLLYIVHRFY